MIKAIPLSLIAGAVLLSPAGAVEAPAGPIPQPVCIQQPLIPPSGVTDRSNEPFPAADHHFLHSSAHLQGQRATVKFAGGLLYMPAGIPEFSGFTSAVVVNNADPAVALTFNIDYFDHTGALMPRPPTMAPMPATIAAEATHIEAAIPLGSGSGIGHAVVTMISGNGLVGATLLNTECISFVCDPDLPRSINGRAAGMSSKQQLQVVPGANTLHWGPVSLTRSSPVDFLNGQAPFYFVVNPNPTQVTVQVDLLLFDRIAGVTATVPWRTQVIPGNGTFLDKAGSHIAGSGLWDAFMNIYLNPAVPVPDFDVTVRVRNTSSDAPILGDGFITDIFGDDAVATVPPNNLHLGKRFRMVSTMLYPSAGFQLTNPDLSFEAGGGIIETGMNIINIGASDAGPVRIDYLDNTGAPLPGSGTTVANLPPGETLRLHSGVLGYPTTNAAFGWSRIRACLGSDRLIGLSYREITEAGRGQQYHKAYGDALMPVLGAEPGNGFRIFGGTNAARTRKVAPLARTTPSFPWPGYHTFLNDSVPNVGPYEHRLFALPGFACGVLPFNGLRLFSTSWTYQDFWSTCNGNLSGRVDHQSGTIKGIAVIGDPLDEFGIPGFAGVPGPPPVVIGDVEPGEPIE